MTLAEALHFDVLGPLPNNLAYGPILVHIIYLEAIHPSPPTQLLQDFIPHCQDPEYGLQSEN
jgi:hypothetical protein